MGWFMLVVILVLSYGPEEIVHFSSYSNGSPSDSQDGEVHSKAQED